MPVHYNVSKFGGRIFTSREIEPGTFTIPAPIYDAIKWGDDALLSYGIDGIKIWKPDGKTAGVYLFAWYRINSDFWYEIKETKLGDGRISIKIGIAPQAFIVPLFVSLVFWLFGLFIISEIDLE